MIAFSRMRWSICSGRIQVPGGIFSDTFLEKWFARRENIFMKIFADDCLQEAKPEFVTAKLWHPLKATTFSASKAKDSVVLWTVY